MSSHEADRPFEPAPLLGHRHVQTCWSRLTRSRSLVPLRRQLLPTPDGDELIVDHLDGPAGAPRVVLLHGLEGSTNSVYIQGLLAQLRSRGLRAVAVNFRSCAREPGNPDRCIPNRTARLYHSGETADLDLVVKSLVRAEPLAAHAAIGISLGGNVLLKWLGENPGQSFLVAAATISVPYDLEAGSRKLEGGLGPVYVTAFLYSLRKKARQLLARHPEAASRLDVARMRSARTFFDFDDAVTGPLHGFRGAKHYYDTSSSVNWVARITTPTLCLSAEDDPFLPATVLDRLAASASGAVHLVATRHGGHAGFVGGTSPLQVRYWAEERATEFVARHLAGD